MLTAAESLCARVIGELLKACKGIEITQKPLENGERVGGMESFGRYGDERKKGGEEAFYTISVVAGQNFGFMNI